MTRINVVPVETLHHKHLVAEYKESTRIFGYARKAQFDIIKGKRKIPENYVLGEGHVTHFMNKLGYITKRYEQLTAEMIRRGYKPNPISTEELEKGIDRRLFNDYTPTPEAIEINLQRINERLGEMK